MKSIITERDEVIDHVRKSLKRLIQESDLTQRAVEERNGFAQGYLSQALGGNMALSARHIFGILLALEMEPSKFFQALFPQPQVDTSDLSEIRERMARYDSAIRELEEKGILGVEPEMQSVVESKVHY